MIAIYPGSFDPPTNGHLDIIIRATRLFPKIIVAVTDNSIKSPTFTIEERVAVLRQATRGLPTVTIEQFSGLLVDYIERKRATVIIRGLRAISDFEYEFQMALMNRRLNRRAETVFLMPDEKNTYLSSSLIKEISRFGGPTRGLVPRPVEKLLKTKRS